MANTILVLTFCAAAFLLLYPFVIYPLLLMVLRPARPRSPDGPPLSFALLFSARNEAAALPETLQSLAALKRLWPELQILAWNDASTDETGRILDRAHRLLRVRHGTRPMGKAIALRHLLEGLEADVVLMMDANIRFRADKVINFRNAFADPAIGAVGAVMLPAAGNQESGVGRLYWRLEEWIKRRESLTGSTIGCDGALWGIRRQLYPQFGAHASDDFRPSVEAMLKGYRVISDPRIEVREAAIPDIFAPRRAMRIGCGAWHAHRQIWRRVWAHGGIDLFKYVSHKLVRWFAGLWLVMALASGLWLVALNGLLAEAAVLAALGATGAVLGIPPFRGVWRIAATFLGTTIGVLLAALGGTMPTWLPLRAV